MKQLNKKITKAYQGKLTPEFNLIQAHLGLKYKILGTDPLITMMTEIQRATYYQQIADSFPKRVDFYSQCFGGRPSFYEMYEYKNAVWGFEIDAVPFCVYYSKKGLSIEVHPVATKNQLYKIMKAIHQRIVK